MQRKIKPTQMRFACRICLTSIVFLFTHALAGRTVFVLENQSNKPLKWIGITMEIPASVAPCGSVPIGLTYSDIEPGYFGQLVHGYESMPYIVRTISWIDGDYGLRVLNFSESQWKVGESVLVKIPAPLVIDGETIVSKVDVTKFDGDIEKSKRPFLLTDIAGGFLVHSKPEIDLSGVRERLTLFENNLRFPSPMPFNERELWRYQKTMGFIAGLHGNDHARSYRPEVMEMLFPNIGTQFWAGPQANKKRAPNGVVTRLFELSISAEREGFDQAKDHLK